MVDECLVAFKKVLSNYLLLKKFESENCQPENNVESVFSL